MLGTEILNKKCKADFMLKTRLMAFEIIRECNYNCHCC